MKVYVTGAAVVKRDMYATLRSGIVKMNAEELFQIAHLNAILAKKSSRFGRFDQYTRIGLAAVGLALHDARLDTTDRVRNIGFILAGQYGSFVTDLAFYETTVDGGQLASPNLFSYTLPNIVIGECAHQFGLIGPTFCLDSDGERAHGALCEAALYLEENSVEAMLVGWLEVLPKQAPKGDEGAIVLVFEKKKNKDVFQLELETDCRNGMKFLTGEVVNSIDKLLQALKMVDISIQKQKNMSLK